MLYILECVVLQIRGSFKAGVKCSIIYIFIEKILVNLTVGRTVNTYNINE